MNETGVLTGFGLRSHPEQTNHSSANPSRQHSFRPPLKEICSSEVPSMEHASERVVNSAEASLTPGSKPSYGFTLLHFSTV
jgi:hypothetical protein